MKFSLYGPLTLYGSQSLYHLLLLILCIFIPLIVADTYAFLGWLLVSSGGLLLLMRSIPPVPAICSLLVFLMTPVFINVNFPTVYIAKDILIFYGFLIQCLMLYRVQLFSPLNLNSLLKTLGVLYIFFEIFSLFGGVSGLGVSQPPFIDEITIVILAILLALQSVGRGLFGLLVVGVHVDHGGIFILAIPAILIIIIASSKMLAAFSRRTSLAIFSLSSLIALAAFYEQAALMISNGESFRVRNFELLYAFQTISYDSPFGGGLGYAYNLQNFVEDSGLKAWFLEDLSDGRARFFHYGLAFFTAKLGVLGIALWVLINLIAITILFRDLGKKVEWRYRILILAAAFLFIYEFNLHFVALATSPSLLFLLAIWAKARQGSQGAHDFGF